jgi:hypothetical protein
MLPKEAIEEFKKIYKKRFGVELTDAEASFRANNLVNLYSAVLGSKSKVSEKLKKKVLPL